MGGQIWHEHIVSMQEKNATGKPVAVVSSYGKNGEVEKMEVSILDADGRSITYKSWINDGMKSIDQVTDEVILFATNHHVGQIQMVDELLPLPT
jgi:hypothetical protein